MSTKDTDETTLVLLRSEILLPDDTSTKLPALLSGLLLLELSIVVLGFLGFLGVSEAPESSSGALMRVDRPPCG